MGGGIIICSVLNLIQNFVASTIIGVMCYWYIATPVPLMYTVQDCHGCSLFEFCSFFLAIFKEYSFSNLCSCINLDFANMSDTPVTINFKLPRF